MISKAQSLSNRALLLAEEGQQQKAAHLLREAIGLEKPNGQTGLLQDLYINLLNIYKLQNERQPILSLIDEIEKEFQPWCALLIEKAFVVEDGKEDCLQKALELDPQNYMAWNNLGVLYFLNGKYSQSKMCFQEAVSINCEFADGWFNLRDCFLELGDHENAKKCQTKFETLSA